MFRFADPEWLYALLAIPVILLAFWGVQRLKARRTARFGDMATLAELMPERSPAREWIKTGVLCAAAALIIVAAARPQVGSKLREVKAEGTEMMLVIDVSNSMLAEDIKPSRIERTKHAIGRFIERLSDDRIGVIVFAGEAQVQLPVTTDYKMAASFVKRISPSMIADQGTDIGSALELAQLSFSGDTHRNSDSRVIILITDGETHDEKSLEVAAAAAERGIKICTIGIGTPDGVPINIGGSYIEDEEGNMVVSKLNEELLGQIASLTGGIYARSTNQSFGLDEIVDELNSMQKSELTIRSFDEFDEQYQYFLAGGIVLLIVEMLILGSRNPLLRGITLFRRRDDNPDGNE
ncbi:MAG: VWA domain-containing protein [Alistipes sp.]|nr:VWA domain-containing protein [Alistipes sp.]